MAYRVSKSANILVEQSRKDEEIRRGAAARRANLKLISELLHFCTDFSREVELCRRQEGGVTAAAVKRLQLSLTSLKIDSLEDLLADAGVLSDNVADIVRDLVVAKRSLDIRMCSILDRPPLSNYGKEQFDQIQQMRPQLFSQLVDNVEGDFEQILDLFDKLLKQSAKELGASGAENTMTPIRELLGRDPKQEPPVR
jgi:hypothetical protein